jgi:hypothetical protein
MLLLRFFMSDFGVFGQWFFVDVICGRGFGDGRHTDSALNIRPTVDSQSVITLIGDGDITFATLFVREAGNRIR